MAAYLFDLDMTLLDSSVPEGLDAALSMAAAKKVAAWAVGPPDRGAVESAVEHVRGVSRHATTSRASRTPEVRRPRGGGRDCGPRVGTRRSY